MVDPLAEEARLTNLIADAIAPRLLPNIELFTVAGKTLLRVEVFLSNSRPHYLKGLGPEQGVLVRLGSSNRQADTQLIAELGRLAAGEDTRSEEGPDNQTPLYRITARSRATGRAEVVLQTNVMSRIPDPGT